MATLTQAMDHWSTEFRTPEGLMAASRYQLERCADAFWKEILVNNDTPREIVTARRMIQAELRRRAI